MSPDAARAEAARRFGPLDEARERLHASAERREGRMRVRTWWDDLRQDLRATARGLRRAPSLVAVTVLSLALGVGANAAAFSLFDEVLRRPLPVAAPERLVTLEAPGDKLGGGFVISNQAGGLDAVFSYPLFRDLARAPATSRVLAGLAAHRLNVVSLAVDGAASSGPRARAGDAMFVSGSYFPTLGLRPASGRLFGPAEDATFGGHPVAVLGHAYWTAQFGADPRVLGATLRVNGYPMTVVGVAPAGFEGTTLGARPLVYLPMTMARPVLPGFDAFENRAGHWVYVFGRLKPGVSPAQARAALNAVYRPLVAEVEAPLHPAAGAEARARFLARTLAVEDGRHGQSTLRGDTGMPLRLLLALTALVVLIACANVANLLLARGAARTTELAVRASLGAGRRRLVRQLLTEAGVLALLGGVASLAVAYAALRGVGALIPPAQGGVGAGASLALALRPAVLAFAAAVAVGTGLLFGVFPSLHATRPDLMTAIRAGSGQPAGARAAGRARAALVTAQVALATALLVTAGLFVRSLGNVSRVDLGLAPERVVAFTVAPARSGYDEARERALYARLEEELAAAPGVTGAAASAVPLFAGISGGGAVRVEGAPPRPGAAPEARRNAVGPGYFRTLGTPLVAGREFTPADRPGAPKVAVINEAFVRAYGLGPRPQDAVGRRLATDAAPGAPADVEIVGVARDARYDQVKGAAPALVYTPWRQAPSGGDMTFYVRTVGAAEPALRTVAGVVRRLDPALPLDRLAPLPQQVRENVYLDRMVGTLSAAFAALATLLAAVGLYGVLAYTVAQRRREFGLRMALGADAARVRALVVGEVGRLAAVGGAAGVLGALALGRAARSLLFGVGGADPASVAAAVAVLAAVALGAAYVPARRASRVEPMRALRPE
jgi:predicted permease